MLKMYILRTEIPQNKKLFISLQKVFGIGKKISSIIIKHIGISSLASLNQLNKHKLQQLIKYVDKNYIIGKELKDLKLQFFETENKLKSYLGQRIRFHLPRRGQRTHTNARTIKKIKN